MRPLALAALILAGCGGGSAASAEAEQVAPPRTHVATSPRADSPSPPPSKAAPRESDPPGTYMGRELAQTMSHLGAGWLTRSNRDAEENTTLMHAKLGLKAGDVACDVGSGNGYHTLKMAEAVGPSGKAIGIDLQPQMLDLLRARAEAEGVANVETILATANDPKIPAATCDLILLVDVYHELSDPAAVLAQLSAALTDRGRIALLEYRAEDPDVPIKRLHKMSKQQVLAEYGANALKLQSEFDGLPWQHMMFFVPE